MDVTDIIKQSFNFVLYYKKNRTSASQACPPRVLYKNWRSRAFTDIQA